MDPAKTGRASGSEAGQPRWRHQVRQHPRNSGRAAPASPAGPLSGIQREIWGRLRRANSTVPGPVVGCFCAVLLRSPQGSAQRGPVLRCSSLPSAYAPRPIVPHGGSGSQAELPFPIRPRRHFHGLGDKPAKWIRGNRKMPEARGKNPVWWWDRISRRRSRQPECCTDYLASISGLTFETLETSSLGLSRSGPKLACFAT